MLRWKRFRMFNFVVGVTTVAGIGLVDFGFEELYFVGVLV